MLSFLTGEGELARLLRELPWQDLPIGPPISWPQSLKTLVGVMLAANQPMFVVWGSAQTMLYNQPYSDILGSKHPAALGQPILQVWSEVEADLRPLVEAAYAGVPSHMDDLMLLIDRNGRREEAHFAYSYTPIRNEAGHVEGFFCPCIEITEQVTVARSMREGRVRNRQIFDSAIDYGIIATDLEGCVTSWNAGAMHLTGWTETEMLGQPIDCLFTRKDRAADRPRQEMAAALATGRGTDGRWHCRKDGTQFWASGQLTVLRDAADQPVGFVKVLSDSTAQREAEERLRELNATLEESVAFEVEARMKSEDALRQAQKVEAIGQLTGGVAHDFNNLLTVIRGSVDLLRRPDVSAVRRARYIDAIGETADRATRLTGQLLAFARRQTLEPETFDVRESVQAIRGMIGTLTGSRIEIVVALPESRCLIHTDRSQFDTAIVNMAVNARDAMSGEGRLTMEVAHVSGIPDMRSHPHVAGEFVAVTISDTGVGIEADQIDRIFEPFFTTKSVGEGTGLGLSQVFGFAKQAGGEIAVESRIGEGASFTLYLPATTGPEEISEDAPVVGLVGGGEGARVLVVEDNAEVGRFATAALAELDYETVLAVDGKTALAELATRNAAFDVVFTDVVMPGISGIELGQEIRRLYPGLPVILTSGYSTVLADDGTHGFELLRKPYSIEELSRVLGRALQRRA